MAINPQITVDISPSIATTTNGSATVTVLSVPFHEDTGGQMITFDLVGYDFDNGEIATAKIAVKVKNTSGTLSMVGTPVHLVPIQAGSSTGLRNASASVVVSGSNINLNVIGVADRTIKWVAYRSPSVEVLDNWTPVPTPGDGYIQWWVDGYSRWEPVDPAVVGIGTPNAGGDLDGTYPDPTVVSLTGNAGIVTMGTGGGTAILQGTGTDIIIRTGDGGDSNEFIQVVSASAAADGYAATILGDDIRKLLFRSNINTPPGPLPKDFTIGFYPATTPQGQPDDCGALNIVGQNGPSSNGVGYDGAKGGNINITGGYGGAGGGAGAPEGGDGGNGGTITISSGLAGAAGSASNPGVDGDIILKTGSTTRMTVSPTAITISGATISLPDITTSTSASAGAQTLPANPVGFISVTIGGTVRKIPYYAE